MKYALYLIHICMCVYIYIYMCVYELSCVCVYGPVPCYGSLFKPDV